MHLSSSLVPVRFFVALLALKSARQAKLPKVLIASTLRGEAPAQNGIHRHKSLTHVLRAISRPASSAMQSQLDEVACSATRVSMTRTASALNHTVPKPLFSMRMHTTKQTRMRSSYLRLHCPNFSHDVLCRPRYPLRQRKSTNRCRQHKYCHQLNLHLHCLR